MDDKHESIDDGFIVPVPMQQGEITQNTNAHIFEELKKITPEEIGEVGTEIYYRGMVRKLEEGYEGEPLDLGLAVYLFDHGKVKLLLNNFGKFDKIYHREIIFKFIKFLGEKGSLDQKDMEYLALICPKIDKEIATLLVDNNLGRVISIKFIPLENLDIDIVNKLKEKKYSLLNLKLNEFVEEDRKDVALEIIKAGGEPDLSVMTTLTLRPDHENVELNYAGTLTLDFALEIINIGTVHAYKYLSNNMKYFDPSARKSIAMRYIEDGREDCIIIDWFYDHMVFDKETFFKLIDKKGSEDGFSKAITKYLTHYYYPDKDIADKLAEKGYDFQKYGGVLFFFSDDSKCYVAVLILKNGGEPDLSLIPKEYLTQEFALDIVNIGTQHTYKFLANNIELFDEAVQKILAIKYIEAGYRTYVDAMWPPEVINNSKGIAISLINKGLEKELKFRFTCLDVDVVNELKKKKYDFKKLSNELGCFVETDRKVAALEMIRAGGEPDLSFIPTGDLTKEFALEIINTKQDAGLKALSLGIPFFKASLINDIVLELVDAGGWEYIKNEVLKTNRFDKCLDKGFILALLRSVGAREAGTVLKKFSGLDSDVASIFINVGALSVVIANLESFNNLNSEIARSLINGGYKSVVKKNIERFNLDNETIKLLMDRKDKIDFRQRVGKQGKFKKLFGSLRGSKEGYEDISDETNKILQELPNFHKEWKDHRDVATDDMREKIIKAAEKIPVDIDIDPDGNKIFKLKLKDRTLQILIPRLENYTDKKYEDEITFDADYCSAFDFNNKLHKSYVKLGGIDCGDISKRKNKKLAKYVNEKENEGYRIPSKKDMMDILCELGESAGLDIDEERKNAKFREISILTTMQMLLLMYLIGSPALYWLSDLEESSDNQQERLIMTLSRFYGSFDKMGNEDRSAGILMIK